MRFPFFRNRDSVKNGILISIRRTGDGFHPGLFKVGVRRDKVNPYKACIYGLCRVFLDGVGYDLGTVLKQSFLD